MLATLVEFTISQSKNNEWGEPTATLNRIVYDYI